MVKTIHPDSEVFGVDLGDLPLEIQEPFTDVQIIFVAGINFA